MRRRWTVSIFLTRGACACAERGETCAEASAVVTAFFPPEADPPLAEARGFRAFFIVASAVIGLASVRLRVGEPAEYALSAKKTQSRPFSEGAGRNPVYESGRLCFLSLFTVHCSL